MMGLIPLLSFTLSTTLILPEIIYKPRRTEELEALHGIDTKDISKCKFSMNR